jgi:hypothetical protein
MTKHDFFFCYDKKLADFIRYKKGIDFITVAQNPKTKKVFALFPITKELQKAIDEYKNL